MRLILPIHWPSVRKTVGSSFGPIAISATMPMITSLPQSSSNIGLANSQARQAPTMPARSAAQSALLRAHSPGALGVRFRRTGSLMIDVLGRLRFVRRLVVFRHALFERLDALREVSHQRRNLASSPEQDHHDHQDDDPMPYT